MIGLILKQRWGTNSLQPRYGLLQLAHRQGPALWLNNTRATSRGSTCAVKGSNNSQISKDTALQLKHHSQASSAAWTFWVWFLVPLIVHPESRWDFTALSIWIISAGKSQGCFEFGQHEGWKDFGTCSDIRPLFRTKLPNFEETQSQRQIPDFPSSSAPARNQWKEFSGGNPGPVLGFDPFSSSLISLVPRQEKVQL